MGYKFSRCGGGDCPCGEEPDADCPTSATCQSFAVSPTVAQCEYYDHDANGWQLPQPASDYAVTMTVSGATGDLAALNGVYATDATEGATGSNGCIIKTFEFSWSKNYGTPCNPASGDTDAPGGSGVITVNIQPRGTSLGWIANAGGSFRWCSGGSFYEAEFAGIYDCATGTIPNTGVGNTEKDGVAWSPTGGAPTLIELSIPNSGDRDPGRLLSIVAMTDFRKQILSWLMCGGSFSPSTLTLKIFNGSTNAEIGSATIATPWTYNSGISCYEHSAINVTTTASLTHAHGLKSSLWWGTQELHTKVTHSCGLTGLPNPLPSGTVLAVTPAPFRFTGVPASYTKGIGHLLNQYFLLMTSPNLSKEIVGKNSSGVVEETYTASFQCLDDSTLRYAKSDVDVVQTSAVTSGTSPGGVYLQTTDGVGIVRFADSGMTFDGCNAWWPAGYLQWRT